MIASFLLLATLAPPAAADGADPWYTAHVFEGEEGCLAVREGQRLSPGDRMDAANWYVIAEHTLGFMSRDGGSTWDHLSIDVGFEGTLWAIRRLAEGTPTQWEFYLYTQH